MRKNRYWIAVVSREHVLNAMKWEILQVCHGKKAPLKRIKKDDYIILYSSKNKMWDKEPLQRFTAIAQAVDDDIYQERMFEGFEPFRRKVRYLSCSETKILPLINKLDFISNKKTGDIHFDMVC